MRFEFSLARKYLWPRRRQLSVSLICLLSVFVITLVVWLLLTFLSVMGGIEKGWLEKLTSLNAPVKVCPTHNYFNSYYYQIDSIASNSNYSLKSIGEKRLSDTTDPYIEDIDTNIPQDWQLPDRSGDGSVKDLVKEAFGAIDEIHEPGMVAQEFELSGAMLRLKLVRGDSHHFLSQVAFVTNFADKSPYVQNLITEKVDLAPDENGVPGMLLPNSFANQGVIIGDHGFLSYGGSGASSGQEMRLKVRVAGFYNPGVMAIGPKCVLVPPNVSSMLHSTGDAYSLDPTESSGIQVWFDDLSKAEDVKHALQAKLDEKGLTPYWRVLSYHDYDFAKDLLQQFKSDKMLFTLIATIILIVAASNIISSLVLLVNNKKKEIGILQSMGASKKSIVSIFALCGVIIGAVSSIIGGVAAYLTLANIDTIIGFISYIQGHDLFNSMFYDSSFPSTLSKDAVIFIAIATPVISLLAGLIPAIKAARLSPSQILRSE